jgi:hypothetical protein
MRLRPIEHRRASSPLVRLRKSELGLRLAFYTALAFLLAPFLHMARHRDDHEHVVGGIRWTEPAHEHPHRHPETPFPVVQAPMPVHGQGGLAHFGLATLAAAPFIPPRVLFPVEPLACRALPLAPPRVRLLLSARPRGPPPSSSASS